jgi:hypothetical protein
MKQEAKPKWAESSKSRKALAFHLQLLSRLNGESRAEEACRF